MKVTAVLYGGRLLGTREGRGAHSVNAAGSDPCPLPSESTALTGMRTSVVTFESRLARRFRYLAADASLYARTDAESVRVERVVQAVAAGVLPMRDGYEAVAALRRQQQQRKAA